MDISATATAATPRAPQAESAAVYLERIAASDRAQPPLAAVIAVAPEAMRDEVDVKRKGVALAGLSVLIKDNVETRDMPTTAGSLALADNRTGRDAPLVSRLRTAGAIILGKTNLSEWANFRSSLSSSGWSGVGGQSRNPHGLDRSPCGSSSGSGAAVAAGLAWAAVGTETDGSITCPASVNGIVGFKPTVGMISRSGIVPISHVQDTPGPMTRSVADAALMLEAMAGVDAADPATATAPAKARAGFVSGLADASLKGVRIGVLVKQIGPLPRVAELFEAAKVDLVAAGAELVPIEFTVPDALGKAEQSALLYEFRTDLDRYLAALPGHPQIRSLAALIAFNKAHSAREMRWFEQDLLDQALAATDVAAYTKARADAFRLAGPEGVDRLLRENGVAALIAPTSGPAWSIDLVNGDHVVDVGAGSLPAVAGYPHLTVPMGAVEGLPVGLSFIGRAWDDAAILRIGAAYERARHAVLAVATTR
jgi:amidase